MTVKEYNQKYYYSHQEEILAQKRAYQKANPEKLNERNRTYYKTNEKYRLARQAEMRRYKRNWRLEREYDFTEEQFAELLKQQEGKCAICKTEKWGGKHNIPHIDHDHSTGKVRGLLCGQCNRGLGMFKDSMEALSGAVIYLQKHYG